MGTWKSADDVVVLVLNADGTGKYVRKADQTVTIKFKWNKTDDGIELLNPDGGNPDTGKLTGDGTLRITDGDNGKTVALTRE